MRHFAGYYPAPRDVDEVIVAVGLEEKRRTKGFDLSGGQIPPPSLYSATTETAFAALYPNGSVFVTNATPSYSLPGMGGGAASVLVCW